MMKSAKVILCRDEKTHEYEKYVWVDGQWVSRTFPTREQAVAWQPPKDANK
jgi:hypothetical protein